MPRIRQTFTCNACGHRAERVLVFEPFDPQPDPERLKRKPCSKGGARDCRVDVELMLPAWADAFNGGMKLGRAKLTRAGRLLHLHRLWRR